MKRLLSSLCTLGFALSFVQADCTTPTPPVADCPTTVQSVTYKAAGSCGAAGVITIQVPTAGQCAITVVENQNVQLPSTGQFTTAAAGTSYDLAKGNWELAPPPAGMMGDSAGLDCSISRVTTGGFDLLCNITACSIVGDNDEVTCGPAGVCDEHLTPAPAGAKPDLDAGLGTAEAGTD